MKAPAGVSKSPLGRVARSERQPGRVASANPAMGGQMTGTSSTVTDSRPRTKQPERALSLIGRRFGRLVVTGRAPHGSQRAIARGRWECACDRGARHTAMGRDLLDGLSHSCGCIIAYLRHMESVARGTAGLHEKHAAEYSTWTNLKQRCLNPRHPKYPDYGGRGVTVCARWSGSFANFFADMGARPSAKHSIDRINNDGNYEPGNCRWATPSVQTKNQRRRVRGATCRAGHELSIDNAYLTPRGYRECRECRRRIRATYRAAGATR